MTKNLTLKQLRHSRSLRALASDLTLDDLNKIIGVLSEVVEERKLVMEQQKAEEEAKREKLEAIRQQLIADGFDPDVTLKNLASNVNKSQGKRKNKLRPAKYEFLDADGKKQTWTGQGRTPKPIQTALDAGRSLDEFLIQS